MSFKKWLAVFLLIPGYAFASPSAGQSVNPQPPYLNIIAPNVIDGVNVNPTNAAPGSFTTLTASGAFTPKGTTTFTSAVTFSSAATFNNTATLNSAATMADTTTTFTSAGPTLGTTTQSGTDAINNVMTFSSAPVFNNVPVFNSASTFNNVPTFNSAQTFNNVPTFNSAITMKAAGINTFGTVFSNSMAGNPLIQATFASFTSSQAQTGVNVLNSAAGRTIFPGNFTIMVSGSPSGATNVFLECQPSANLIATFPISALIDSRPIGPTWTSASTANPTPAKALIAGCQAADAVLLSAPSLTGSSQIFVNLPYIVQ